VFRNLVAALGNIYAGEPAPKRLQKYVRVRPWGGDGE
jgi:hypothetical protein